MGFCRVQKTAGVAVQVYVNRSEHEQEVALAPWREDYVMDAVERGHVEGSTLRIPPHDYAAIVYLDPEKQHEEA